MLESAAQGEHHAWVEEANCTTAHELSWLEDGVTFSNSSKQQQQAASSSSMRHLGISKRYFHKLSKPCIGGHTSVAVCASSRRLRLVSMSSMLG
jgi:hypothetical protein